MIHNEFFSLIVHQRFFQMDYRFGHKVLVYQWQLNDTSLGKFLEILTLLWHNFLFSKQAETLHCGSVDKRHVLRNSHCFGEQKASVHINANTLCLLKTRRLVSHFVQMCYGNYLTISMLLTFWSCHIQGCCLFLSVARQMFAYDKGL